MKKILVLTAILMIFSLSSCSDTVPVQQSVPAQTETVIITPTPAAQTETDLFAGQRVIVNIETTSIEVKDPESGVYSILEYYIENPVVTVENNPEVSGLINQKIEEINESYILDIHAVNIEMDYFTYLQSMAEDNYMLKKDADADLSAYGSFSRTVDISVVDEQYLNLYFFNLLDMNSVEETSENLYFDLLTGEYVQNLEDSETSKELYSDAGSINVKKMDSIEDNFSLSILDLITVCDDGDDYLLVVNGELNNVSISKVGYVEGRFVDINKLWYCNHVSDAAIQIKTSINQSNPDLKISYDSSDGKTGLILGIDNDTGEIILSLENSYESVG